MMSFIEEYLEGICQITKSLQHSIIEDMVKELLALRTRGGRLFLFGIGGSAANCSHAVNDFRKLCGIEAYTPVDNISELTARANDDGWEKIFSSWLVTSRANANDLLFILSVGGGDAEQYISPNIVEGLDEAKKRDLKILGIVGREGGYTKKKGDHVLVIPTIAPHLITPYAESFQTIIWHALVSHPSLCIQKAKWEEVGAK